MNIVSGRLFLNGYVIFKSWQLAESATLRPRHRHHKRADNLAARQEQQDRERCGKQFS